MAYCSIYHTVAISGRAARSIQTEFSAYSNRVSTTFRTQTSIRASNRDLTLGKVHARLLSTTPRVLRRILLPWSVTSQQRVWPPSNQRCALHVQMTCYISAHMTEKIHVCVHQRIRLNMCVCGCVCACLCKLFSPTPSLSIHPFTLLSLAPPFFLASLHLCLDVCSWYVYIQVGVCMHVCIYACVCMYVYVCVCMFVSMYVCLYVLNYFHSHNTLSLSLSFL